MSLFQGSTIPVLEQVVNFTEARHGVLAGNIANLDTPGYKTRDLSPELFVEKLKGAIKNRNTQASEHGPDYSPGLDGISGPVTATTKGTDPFGEVKESFKSVLRHDNADVSMEHQVTELAKNQMQHNLAISIMISQFQLLQAAISERA